MTLPQDETSASNIAILVEFSYEDPETVVRYARWETDVSHGGNTYTSLTALDVELPEIDGTTQETTAFIDIKEVAPLPAMRTTFPPVSIKIIEIDPEVADSAYTLFEGRVSQCNYSYNGNPTLVRVEVSGPTKDLESSVSFRIGRFCANVFGQSPCPYDREVTKETVTITAISGSQITVSGLTLLDPAFWKHGGVRYRGFEIPIHFQESLSVLHLTKPAPLHWEGVSVDVLAGCDKTITTCRLRGQEENFTGIGINLPLRDIRVTE